MMMNDSNFIRENCFILLSLLRSVTDTMYLPDDIDFILSDLCERLEGCVGDGWQHFITENEKGDILDIYSAPCSHVVDCDVVKCRETVGSMQ